MPYTTDSIMSYVLEDVKKYEGIRHLLKASHQERLFVTKLPPQKLHPNPDDEFSWKNVGPNDKIIRKYMLSFSDAKPKKPLIIEKMAPEDYMLINGHHRWAAAMKLGLKSVPVQIVNPTKEDDLLRMMNRSDRTMRVSLDLDEVVFVPKDSPCAEKPTNFLNNMLYKFRIRKHLPMLLKEFQFLGFDIWVYTASYLSDEYIHSFFKSYGIEVDGIVNGVRRKHQADKEHISALFSSKYTTSVHIDTEGVILTRPNEKSFESFELNTENDDWALDTIRTLKQYL